MKARVSSFTLASTILCLAAPLHADSATWTGSTDGLWSDTSNWSGPPTTVPSVAGEVATFDGDGNGNTTITDIPSLAIDQILFDVDPAAYTFTSSITWSMPADGGVTMTDLVSTDQDLSGIQFIRPTVNSTANFENQAVGTTLTLGTIFSQNTGSGTTNARLRFAPAADAFIEIPSSKLLDNAGTNGVKKMSVLLDDDGVLNVQGVGSFNGTDAEGNSVTIRRGTLIPRVVIPASATRSSLGTGGRIQFGQAGQAYTATLQYENATNATTDRPFHFIDGNTGVFDIVDELVTMELTGVLTASGTTNGGGNLTKKGLGTLKISGAANTYNGVTRIEDGTLVLGDVLAIQNSAYDTSSPGVLDLSELGGNPTFGGLTSATDYDLPSDLTLNPPSGITVTFSGVLGESTPNLSLTKSGGGTQVLAGDNTFTGNVTVTAGQLTLAHSNALGLTEPGEPFNGRKGLVSQGTGRRVALRGDITIPDTIDMYLSSNSFDGGGLINEDGNNEIQGPIFVTTGNPSLNISSVTGALTISGNVTLTATARPLLLGGASEADNTISGNIGESSSEVMPITKQGAGQWILSGNNTYKGDTTVNDGTLVLANGGSQAFYPKTDGTSNKITGNGTGTITLDGALAIDLTNATTATSWLLVDVDNLDETYGTNFAVTDFTETAVDSGVWTRTEGSNTYTFTEADGLLTRESTGDDYTTWADSFTPAVGAETEDDDNDGLTNFEEYSFGLIPTSGASVNPISEKLNNGTGQFKYTRRATPGTTGVTYTYESSTTLSGAWDPFTPDSETSDSATPVEEITVDIPDALLANPKLFIRVKAVKP